MDPFIWPLFFAILDASRGGRKLLWPYHADEFGRLFLGAPLKPAMYCY